MSMKERSINHILREKILSLDPSSLRIQFFRPDEGMKIYHIGRGLVMDLAEEADALSALSFSKFHNLFNGFVLVAQPLACAALPPGGSSSLLSFFIVLTMQRYDDFWNWQ